MLVVLDFEITTVLLQVFVVKNAIETLFFWKQTSNQGVHYTWVNTVYSLYFKESEGLIVEFVYF